MVRRGGKGRSVRSGSDEMKGRREGWWDKWPTARPPHGLMVPFVAQHTDMYASIYYLEPIQKRAVILLRPSCDGELIFLLELHFIEINVLKSKCK